MSKEVTVRITEDNPVYWMAECIANYHEAKDFWMIEPADIIQFCIMEGVRFGYQTMLEDLDKPIPRPIAKLANATLNNYMAEMHKEMVEKLKKGFTREQIVKHF